MAVNRDPILKRCRALDLSPAVLGYDKKSNRNPNGNKRKKESEYASQLKEKQKLKFIYGVLEKQFYHYYELATKEEGIAGENLLKLLESRLDNVVFRMGMACTRREARQLVSHGHFCVNGKRVDIPSYRVKGRRRYLPAREQQEEQEVRADRRSCWRQSYSPLARS